MYEAGDIPNDYKVEKTVTIPKKVGSDKCENYRTTSLTTHASKILTTIIIYTGLEQTIESSLDEDQFGFWQERETREVLLSLRLMQNVRLRVGKPAFIAFLNLEKTLDSDRLAKTFQNIEEQRDEV